MVDPDLETIEIGDGRARAVIAPAIGGGLARFDMYDGNAWRPIMRPYAAPKDGKPPAFSMAMNVLVPWSNRISGGGITCGATQYALSPNVEGEPYPIHGDGWLNPWRVEAIDGASARLSHDGRIGPYTYAAKLDYRIEGGALDVRLSVKHQGDIVLPYGLGLHPWFVRDHSTRLRAPAEAMWLEGRGHLPTERVNIADPRAYDGRALAALPNGWINAGFDGWGGRATLRWADGAGVSIEALRGDGGAGLDRFVLFSPSAEVDFVCFEPVSHAIDAPNLPGGALAHGMTELKPGESAAIACRFTPLDASEGDPA